MGTVTNIPSLPDNTTLERVGGKLSIKDGGVTTTQILDGTILNADVSSSASLSASKISGGVIGSSYPYALGSYESGIGAATKSYEQDYIVWTSTDASNARSLNNPVEQEINNKTIYFNSKISSIDGSGNIYIGFSNMRIYIDYSSGLQYTFQTINSGTESTILSGVDLTTEAEIKFVHNGTTIELYIDDVLKATHNTNIPTANDYFFIQCFKGGSSTSAIAYLKLNSYNTI